MLKEGSNDVLGGSAPWSWWQRSLFRFAFVFWGYFCLELGLLSQLLWVAPWLDRWVTRWPIKAVEWPFERLAAWLTVYVFHLTGDAAKRHDTGSGDTAQDWVSMLASVLLAALIAAVWTGISEWRGRRREYRTLYAWLSLVMRFALGGILISYGFSKVFDLQFSPPGTRILNERYGDSSPMRLLWTLMGYSIPYTVFSGLMEVVPGLLLMFRRTMTVGALGTVAVMLNVVLLNLCYDVPVKLFSTLYLLMALFLLLPDMAPMMRFFVGGAQSSLRGVWIPKPERRMLWIATCCLKVLVIGHMVYLSVGELKEVRARRTANVAAGDKKADDIDGLWTVDAQTGWPAGAEWKTVRIGAVRLKSVDYFAVVGADGKTVNLAETMDLERRVHFLEDGSELTWTRDGAGVVTMNGTWKGQEVSMRMRSLPGSYPLMTRGFHWVQEYPFNR